MIPDFTRIDFDMTKVGSGQVGAKEPWLTPESIR